MPEVLAQAPTLTLHGVPVYVSGTAGQVASDGCTLRIRWRIGPWRISTVGGLNDGGSCYAPIGAFRWSETFVFRVVDAPGDPDGRVRDREAASTVATSCLDTREAEALHNRVAEAVARVVAGGHGDDLFAVVDAISKVPRSAPELEISDELRSLAAG